MFRKEGEISEPDAEETPEQQQMSAELKKMAENAEGDQEMEKFSAQETVNGTEIQVSWTGHNYEIYFPQIDLEEAVLKNRMFHDQTIPISEDPAKAKRVFEFAKQTAGVEKDVEKVYFKVEDFCRELQHEQQ